MKSNVGLWIDHRKAVIVSLTEKVGKTTRVISRMEKHVRFSGGAQDSAAEDQRDRRFTGHLDKYYDRVVASIRGANSILILGPGEAKAELKARLKAEALDGRIAGIETVDKMTDQQIVARVRQHFLNSAAEVHQNQKH